jgi:Spy/CpxP family protein refolding chaperone
MSNLKGFVWMALVAMLVAAPAVTAEEATKEKTPAAGSPRRPPPKEKGPQDALRGEYAIMAAECKLTPEQQDTLKAKIAARRDAQEAWMKANGSKLESLQEAVKHPKDPNDTEAIRRASEELKALEADHLKIQATFEADLRAMMTPEQRQDWEAFKLYRPMMGRYKKLNLVEGQVQKIRDAAAAAAKELAEVKGDDKAARGAKGEVETKLRKTIEETILTAEQREVLNKPSPPKPGAVKKAAENK